MAPAVRGTALVALAGAALALGTAGLAQGHTRVYFNSLSMAFHGSSAGDSFDGRVSSAKPICEQARKVVVYKAQPGSDARIGADLSRSNGKWEVDPPGKFVRPGRYYASMRSKVLRSGGGHEHSCAPVTTAPLHLGVGGAPRRPGE